MKQPIRFFSVGLLLASVIMFVVYMLDDSPTINSDISNLNTDEMVQALEVEGFHVLSSSEYIKLSVGNDTEEDDDANSDKNDSKDKDEQKDKNKNDSNNKKKDQKDNNDSSDTDNADENDANDETDTNDNDEEEVVTYTISVEPNMLGPDISQLLYDNSIIDDTDKFNRYLEVEGYAPYIQLGDHQVSSDMNYEEIAKKIANH